jgi:hypothetical protein
MTKATDLDDRIGQFIAGRQRIPEVNVQNTAPFATRLRSIGRLFRYIKAHSMIFNLCKTPA